MSSAHITRIGNRDTVLCGDVPDKATADELSRYAQRAYEMGRKDEHTHMRSEIERTFKIEDDDLYFGSRAGTL